MEIRQIGQTTNIIPFIINRIQTINRTLVQRNEATLLATFRVLFGAICKPGRNSTTVFAPATWLEPFWADFSGSVGVAIDDD